MAHTRDNGQRVCKPQCSSGNLLSNPELGPGTVMGHCGNYGIEDEWFQERAIVVASSCGCYTAPEGTDDCAGVPKSTARPGNLASIGSILTADHCVAFEVTPVPSGSSSQTEITASANPSGSQENVRLGASIGRYVDPGQIQSSGMLGDLELTLNLATMPAATGTMAGVRGRAWNSHAWCRDLVMGLDRSDLASGVSIALQ